MKWPSFNPGDFPHKVTIQQHAVNPAIGKAGATVTWDTFLETWASIDHVRALEQINSGQITSQLFTKITIPYSPGIAANMRVIADNQNLYLIEDVANALGMNVKIELYCIALGNNTQ